MAGHALGIDSQNATRMSFADLRPHKIKRTKRDLARSHADHNVNGIVYENGYPISVRSDACPTVTITTPKTISSITTSAKHCSRANNVPSPEMNTQHTDPQNYQQTENGP